MCPPFRLSFILDSYSVGRRWKRKKNFNYAKKRRWRKNFTIASNWHENYLSTISLKFFCFHFSRRNFIDFFSARSSLVEMCRDDDVKESVCGFLYSAPLFRYLFIYFSCLGLGRCSMEIFLMLMNIFGGFLHFHFNFYKNFFMRFFFEKF